LTISARACCSSASPAGRRKYVCRASTSSTIRPCASSGSLPCRTRRAICAAGRPTG
jgi:hypothetical protein